MLSSINQCHKSIRAKYFVQVGIIIIATLKELWITSDGMPGLGFSPRPKDELVNGESPFNRIIS
jgi:hypothetical protein